MLPINRKQCWATSSPTYEQMQISNRTMLNVFRLILTLNDQKQGLDQISPDRPFCPLIKKNPFSIIRVTLLLICLQGGVKFPTGGNLSQEAHERSR